MRLRFLLRTLPALSWAAATLYMATSVGAHEKTGGYLLPFLEDTLGLSAAAAEAVHFTLRKLGHVLAYGIFAALVWWALSPGRRRVALALGAALLLALADEALQSLHPGRGSSLLDVVVDFVGAVVAVLWLNRRARPPVGDRAT